MAATQVSLRCLELRRFKRYLERYEYFPSIDPVIAGPCPRDTSTPTYDTQPSHDASDWTLTPGFGSMGPETPWVPTTEDADWLAGDVHVVTQPHGDEVAEIEITVPNRTAFYLTSKAAADACDLDWTIGPASGTSSPATSGLPEGARYIERIAILDAGTYTITVTPVLGRQKVYLDGVEGRYVIDETTGYRGRRWWESDHPYVYWSAESAWSDVATPGARPGSVTEETPPGARQSATVGAWVEATVTVPGTGGPLRLVGTAGPGAGRFKVLVGGIQVATWDQYAAAEVHRAEHLVTLAPGEHLLRLEVDSVKNAASSGFLVTLDAAFIRRDDLVDATDDPERVEWGGDYLAALVRTDDGGVRQSAESLRYLTVDACYLMFVLALVFERTGCQHYADALKRALQWFADIQDGDGKWHWGYRRVDGGGSDDDTSPSATYEPWVDASWTGLSPSVTDVRCIDTVQALPATCLYLYAQMQPADTAFIDAVKDTLIAGVDAMRATTYDDANGLFMSAEHFHTGDWHLSEVQRSATQSDAWLGLVAAHLLTGEAFYFHEADRLMEVHDGTFWSNVLMMYSVGLTGPLNGDKLLDQSIISAQPQGWPAWVWGPRFLNRGDLALDELATYTQGDGYSVLLPGQGAAETESSCWLKLGLDGRGRPVAARPYKERVRTQQTPTETFPDPLHGDGAVYVGNGDGRRYGATTAWGVLTLLDAPALFQDLFPPDEPIFLPPEPEKLDFTELQFFIQGGFTFVYIGRCGQHNETRYSSVEPFPTTFPGFFPDVLEVYDSLGVLWETYSFDTFVLIDDSLLNSTLGQPDHIVALRARKLHWYLPDKGLPTSVGRVVIKRGAYVFDDVTLTGWAVQQELPGTNVTFTEGGEPSVCGIDNAADPPPPDTPDPFVSRGPLILAYEAFSTFPPASRSGGFYLYLHPDHLPPPGSIVTWHSATFPSTEGGSVVLPFTGSSVGGGFCGSTHPDSLRLSFEDFSPTTKTFDPFFSPFTGGGVQVSVTVDGYMTTLPWIASNLGMNVCFQTEEPGIKVRDVGAVLS